MEWSLGFKNMKRRGNFRYFARTCIAFWRSKKAFLSATHANYDFGYGENYKRSRRFAMGKLRPNWRSAVISSVNSKVCVPADRLGSITSRTIKESALSYSLHIWKSSWTRTINLISILKFDGKDCDWFFISEWLQHRRRLLQELQVWTTARRAPRLFFPLWEEYVVHGRSRFPSEKQHSPCPKIKKAALDSLRLYFVCHIHELASTY